MTSVVLPTEWDYSEPGQCTVGGEWSVPLCHHWCWFSEQKRMEQVQLHHSQNAQSCTSPEPCNAETRWNLSRLSTVSEESEQKRGLSRRKEPHGWLQYEYWRLGRHESVRSFGWLGFYIWTERSPARYRWLLGQQQCQRSAGIHCQQRLPSQLGTRKW